MRSVTAELQVFTWNVWFKDYAFEYRMENILKTVLDLQPDVVCFQEVIPLFANMIHDNIHIQGIYVMSPFDMDVNYGTISLAKMKLNSNFSVMDFPSHQGRNLLLTTFVVNGQSIAVGNAHLESLNNHNVREAQLKISYSALEKFDISFLVGDFNFDSDMNFGSTADDHVNEELENNSLQKYMHNFIDIWPHIHPCPSSPLISSESVNSECKGYSYDSSTNGNIAHKRERMRYDRVLIKASSLYSHRIILVGHLPIENAIVGGERKVAVDGDGSIIDAAQIWPSDHFGLLYTGAIGRIETSALPRSQGISFVERLSTTSSHYGPLWMIVGVLILIALCMVRFLGCNYRSTSKKI